MAENERNMSTEATEEKATEGTTTEEKGRVYTQADIDALIEKRLAREKRDQERRLQEARTAGEKDDRIKALGEQLQEANVER